MATDDGRRAVLLDVTAAACATCAEACERDGAHWLGPTRDACRAAAAACLALSHGRVGD